MQEADVAGPPTPSTTASPGPDASTGSVPSASPSSTVPSGSPSNMPEASAVSVPGASPGSAPSASPTLETPLETPPSKIRRSDQLSSLDSDPEIARIKCDLEKQLSQDSGPQFVDTQTEDEAPASAPPASIATGPSPAAPAFAERSVSTVAQAASFTDDTREAAVCKAASVKP